MGLFEVKGLSQAYTLLVRGNVYVHEHVHVHVHVDRAFTWLPEEPSREA